jgi:hypothetical protein
MNRNSQFDVYAVELEYYRHQTFEIIIPKMFGTEVKKDVVSAKSSPGARRKWDETSYWQEVNSKLDAPKIEALRRLYDWVKVEADTIRWGTGATRGSFNPQFTRISPISFVSVFTDGVVQVSFGYLPEDVELRKRLRDTLARYINVPGVTDLGDTELNKWPSIPADYVQEHADDIVRALTEFIKS